MATFDELMKAGDPLDPDLVSLLAAEGIDTPAEAHAKRATPSARPAPGLARWARDRE
jgi:hypothetical protein